MQKQDIYKPGGAAIISIGDQTRSVPVNRIIYYDHGLCTVHADDGNSYTTHISNVLYIEKTPD